MSSKKINTSNQTQIYGELAPKYFDRGLTVIPVQPGTKFNVKGFKNMNCNFPGAEKQVTWMNSHPHCGIGLNPGNDLPDGTRMGAVDIDQPLVVNMVRAAIGKSPCVKRGRKGETIFVRFEKGMTSKSVRPKRSELGQKSEDDKDCKPWVEFFLTSGMVVLPPSVHPITKKPYEWIGTPLHEAEFEELPFLTKDTMDLICAIAKSEHTEFILGGEGTHIPMRSLTAQGLWKYASDDELLVILSALFPSGYKGDTIEELPVLLAGAREKRLGVRRSSDPYDPGDEGPIPLGHLPDGRFALRMPEANRVDAYSSQSLASETFLMGLASRDFWIRRFPKFNLSGAVTRIDAIAAADAIMQGCREKGPFDPIRVRGCGVWLEKEQVVVNLGGELPQNLENHYVCFYPLPALNGEPPTGKAVLEILQYFNWSRAGDALLLLGWLKLAPVSGALRWRPHLFITGSKNTGKTTLVRGVEGLLEPLVIVLDGTSTEAGIRQTLDADSLPVVLDEFESDHNPKRMQAVIKLARSASSTQGAVARGTPEGKAVMFAIRTTFLFAAINPMPGTAADASRLVTLELLPHDGDQDVRANIELGLSQMNTSTGSWCQQAIDDLPNVLTAIDLFRQAMPAIDSRHALNMATLLAGAFVALEGRAPNQDDAAQWVEQNAELIEHHAEAHEEDDALACLNHLLGSSAGKHPIYDQRLATVGELVQLAITDRKKDGQSFFDTTSLHQFGIRVDNPDSVVVANKHAGLDKIFAQTRWASGAWKTALARIDGTTKPKDPMRFGGPKERAAIIPAHYFPNPDDIEEPPIQF